MICGPYLVKIMLTYFLYVVIVCPAVHFNSINVSDRIGFPPTLYNMGY